MSYFEKRIYEELNLKKIHNKIELIGDKGEKNKVEIFRENSKGDIEILIYTLDRKLITFDHTKATPEKPSIYNEREQNYKITRLHPNRVNEKTGQKYIIPKGQGTFPFIPPQLLKLYEARKEIKTLVLTEGAFKAFKGDMYNIPIIGLSSIFHYKGKDGKMYADVVKIIKKCKVRNIIMLYDGDCRDISLKALKKNEDLYKRPNNFYSSAKNIRDLLKDFEVDFYFKHIKTVEIKEHPKGLDDLLVLKQGHEKAIRKELLSFGSGTYFKTINITDNIKKLPRYLKINKAYAFYEFHEKIIGSTLFIFNGTQYQYNSYDDALNIIMPADAKRYFRVGDTYFEKFQKPNQNKILEEVIKPRMKTTITDDYGGKFLKFIPKYKDFVNIPDHVNYQRVIHNCYNSYYPFIHEAEEGTYTNTLNFIKHLFQEHYELALDYVQLLYQQPTQKLPIVCLVSEDNSTGKSSFGVWLQQIFTQNVTIIGNAEISNDFNAHLASKLIICIDEGFIEKKVIVEKIKKLATANTMPMTKKGKDTEEIDFYGKIIIMTNNIDNFITATEKDNRYWVREVPKLEKEDKDMMKKLQAEIPAFLNFLNKRKLTTKNETRAWFRYDLIRTEAFQNVIKASKPQALRELEFRIKEMFINFKEPEIMLSVKDMKEMFFEKDYRTKEDYIRELMNKHFPDVKKYKNKDGKEVTKWYKIPYFESSEADTFTILYNKKVGRPFVFKIENFLTSHEIENAGLTDEDNGLPF